MTFGDPSGLSGDLLSRPVTRRAAMFAAASAALGLCLTSPAYTAVASRNYSGYYIARGRRGSVLLELVEALPSGAGYISYATIDGIAYLGNSLINGDTITIRWFAPGGSYQHPLGFINGTLSPDGTVITGTFRHALKSGTCRLTAN